MNIFAVLGRLGPARQVELLAWIDDELVADARRLGRPLDHDELQRGYSRAVRKYRRRPTFTATEARKSSLRLLK